jgi:hypothetical protein
MLVGAHVLVFTSDAKADMAFLTDIMQLPSVDAGEGFLIFGLPPAEMAMHQIDAGKGPPPGTHELYVITDDIAVFIEALSAKSIPCEPAQQQGWGTSTKVTLPSGLKLGVYEAHHARPAAKKKAGKVLKKTVKAVRKATKKAAKAVKKAAKKKG